MNECKPLARGGDVRRTRAGLPGRAVQVDSMKPILKAPETKLLKPNNDKLLSILTCAAAFWHAKGGMTAAAYTVARTRQGITLLHFSARRKHILWDTLGA